ncbi:MAG: hypothetical protein AAB091_08015 [Elusimicrobiota bacterium]
MKKLALLLKLRRYSLALYIPIYILAKRRPIRLKDCFIRMSRASKASPDGHFFRRLTQKTSGPAVVEYGKISLIPRF